MSDLAPGLDPQFTKPEEATQDILQQILIELKKINSQLILITDNIINEQDIISDKEDIGP
jgi:hypothetical protein